MIDAAILVGGIGSRLRKITKNTPKPLIKIDRKKFHSSLKKGLRKLTIIKFNFTNNGSKIIFRS